MKKLYFGALALALLALGTGAAEASGLWQGYGPNAGTQTVNGVTVGSPSSNLAVPPLTGNEYAPFDTALPSGQQPQTEGITVGQLGAFSKYGRNLLIGGDFGTNMWARGTSIAAINSTTGVYTANNWAAYDAATSTFAISKQTAGAPAGTQAVLQFIRTASDTHVSKLSLAQEIETANVVPLQGQSIALQLKAKALATYSAAGGTFTVSLVTGTGTDEGISSLAAGTWTGQATLASFTVTPTTSWALFSNMAATVPATATELAVVVSWTPVGTASGSTDGIQLADVQLEQNSVSTAFFPVLASDEIAREQRFYWQLADSKAATFLIPSVCQSTTTSVALCQLLNPVQMRVAPTVAVATATSFGVAYKDGSAGTCGTLAVVASTGSPGSTGLTCTAGAANLVVGGGTYMIYANTGTANTITASADF